MKCSNDDESYVEQICSNDDESYADMELVPPILYDIVAHLQSMANKRTARSIFGKLILAASSYFVWLERNNRLFKNVKRTPEELRDVIM
ncbi:hypothetical protein Tco_1242822, partial [Tanacetum coccineum]